MTSSNREFYAQRIEKVLDFIGSHLEDDLTLDRLCSVAGFSKFHFHRQFRAHIGISATRLIARLRLRRASFQLATQPDRSIVDIALAAGFDRPESFARAFRKAQDQSPSEFRASPNWDRWTDTFTLPVDTRKQKLTPTIVDFSETRIAVFEHRGDPRRLMESVQWFISWRRSSPVSPNDSSETYGIPYSDPETTSPNEFHFDICGSTLVSIPDNDARIIEKTIPKGRCAVARHLGSTDTIGTTVHALYSDWLPDSGETLRDFPCFFHYIARMPTVAEHDQITDVYLPLR